jgi:hypothetical protein
MDYKVFERGRRCSQTAARSGQKAEKGRRDGPEPIDKAHEGIAEFGSQFRSIKGGLIMKKILALTTAFIILFSSLAFASGGKERGSKGQGTTGSTGGGATTQTRGK